jgi:hypothetical protein
MLYLAELRARSETLHGQQFTSKFFFDFNLEFLLILGACEKSLGALSI